MLTVQRHSRIGRPKMAFERDEIEYLTEVPPSGASKAFVEKYAGRVRQKIGLSAVRELDSAVEGLGGRVHFLELDDWAEHSGSIFVHAPQDFDIILPYYTSPLRDRFTIGHELGHYFLHSKQGEIPLVAARKGSGRLEWEANWFAAALLMPVEEFRQVCVDHKDDIERIAATFGVSRDAARIRRDSLAGQRHVH